MPNEGAPSPQPEGPGDRARGGQGWPILSHGFRPFFLLAGLWAIVALNVSLHAFLGLIESPGAFAPQSWHTHEMLFGYAMAVLAGFMLTAIPNWTGRLPLHDGPLAVLVLLWIAGRAAVWFSDLLGPLPTALLDLAFPVALFAVAFREIRAGRNWRNLPICAALAVLALANALVHAGMAGLAVAGAEPHATRLALATFAALIALIGGRIVPSFTRNWLAKTGAARLPAPFGAFDKLALGLAILALLSWVADPGGLPTEGLCAVAALAHALRLARWQGGQTLREPLLAVLHVGYAWIPVALALFAGHAFCPDIVPASVGIHALAVGAIGTMTLAVMSRAIRGHSGRDLTAGWSTTLVFAAITLSALSRVAAPFLRTRRPSP